jgi:hypothetical protein
MGGKRMKKVWRILAVCVVAFSTVIGITLPTSASPTIYESWTGTGDANSIDIYGANIQSEQFTAISTHSITSIKLELLAVLAPVSVTVSLYNAAAGVPTTELAKITYSGSVLADTYTMYEFDIPDTIVLASNQYAIVVSCTNGNATNYVRWHQDSGGGLADAQGVHSHDSGITWTAEAAVDYLFIVYGENAYQVVGANVFTSYAVPNDWLITINTINKYPNYYNVTDPARYFNVQLLNVAGTQVLAATTLKNWGNSVVSIYLSPTSLTPLTYASAYIIKMVGTFAGAPSVTYTLQTTDWVGSNLNYLDQWCLTTAKSMHDYDYGVNVATNPYTTKIANIGDVLTTFGGSDFTTGIYSLMQIRPALFETYTQTYKFTSSTATNVYDNQYTWQNQVGTVVAADATAWGNVFGISAKSLLSMGFWLVYIISMLFVFFNKQGAETPIVLILCIPFLLWGLHLRIIDIQVFMVASAVSAMLWVRRMWWTST